MKVPYEKGVAIRPASSLALGIARYTTKRRQSRRLPDLTFQLGYASFRPAALPVAGKRVPRPLPELTAPAMQQVGLDFQRPRYFCNGNTLFQPLDRGQLELPCE